MEGILFLIPAQMRYNLDSWLVKTILAEIDLRTLLFSWCLCPVVYGRYHKYARVGVTLCRGNHILIIIKIFGRHKHVPTLRSGKVWQIWCFTMFLSILLLLSRNLTPSLVPQTIRISMYQQNIYPILLFPTYIPKASSPLERSRQTEGQNSSPPVT
jgi:hypothetical protein